MNGYSHIHIYAPCEKLFIYADLCFLMVVFVEEEIDKSKNCKEIYKPVDCGADVAGVVDGDGTGEAHRMNAQVKLVVDRLDKEH